MARLGKRFVRWVTHGLQVHNSRAGEAKGGHILKSSVFEEPQIAFIVFIESKN